MMMGILSDNFMVTLFAPDSLLTACRAMLGGDMSWHIEAVFTLVQFHPD